MHHLLKPVIICIFVCLFTGIALNPVVAQESTATQEPTASETATGDRALVLETVKNFYIGDHTGSIEHKKLSMHEAGAYRYINRSGEYVESKFKLDSDDSDPTYKEELLSIEVYENVALARLRLEKLEKKIDSKVEYKLMTMHKSKIGWRITSISWGFGITH